MWLDLFFWICIKAETREPAVITQVCGSFPGISIQISAVHRPFSTSEGCVVRGSWLGESCVEEKVSEVSGEAQKLILTLTVLEMWKCSLVVVSGDHGLGRKWKIVSEIWFAGLECNFCQVKIRMEEVINKCWRQQALLENVWFTCISLIGGCI